MFYKAQAYEEEHFSEDSGSSFHESVEVVDFQETDASQQEGSDDDMNININLNSDLDIDESINPKNFNEEVQEEQANKTMFRCSVIILLFYSLISLIDLQKSLLKLTLKVKRLEWEKKFA